VFPTPWREYARVHRHRRDPPRDTRSPTFLRSPMGQSR